MLLHVSCVLETNDIMLENRSSVFLLLLGSTVVSDGGDLLAD